MHLLHVQIALLEIYIHVSYWLLYVWYVTGLAYITSNVHLYEYYVIMDIWISLFMSCNIIKSSFL